MVDRLSALPQLARERVLVVVLGSRSATLLAVSLGSSSNGKTPLFGCDDSKGGTISCLGQIDKVQRDL